MLSCGLAQLVLANCNPMDSGIGQRNVRRTVNLLTPYLASLLVACSTVPVQQHAVPADVPVEALNPDVRPETIDQTICLPGYAASVRPATTYTNGVKHKLLREAGTDTADASKYELDHVIPLALGGHPRNLRNLALQPWDGDDGAKKKDRLEKQLQRAVCARQIGLREARASIYWDWQGTYVRFFPSHKP